MASALPRLQGAGASRGRVRSLAAARPRRGGALLPFAIDLDLDLDLEREGLTRLRGPKSAWHCREVHEDFLTAPVRFDEPKAAVGVPCLQSAGKTHTSGASQWLMGRVTDPPGLLGSASIERLDIFFCSAGLAKLVGGDNKSTHRTDTTSHRKRHAP